LKKMSGKILRHEWVNRIALKMVPKVGDIHTKSLVSYCGSATAVFQEKRNRLLKIPGIGLSVAGQVAAFKDFERAEKELEFAERHNIKILFYADENYPARLKHLTDAPALFYFKGNANLDHPRTISIVGTRKATDYGKMICHQLVHDLAAQDVLVISGLAYGIDIAAHKAALKNQLSTIAVLAHGLDKIYPSAHRPTALKMLECGGLLTEYMSGSEPDREHFPERNRIVAGLSDAIIVVEAAERGGALITAEFGNAYNKDVFAIPGRVNDEFSKGCNKLIKINKAALVEDAADLLYHLNWLPDLKVAKPRQAELKLDLSEMEMKIIKALSGVERLHIDDLSMICSVPGNELALVLLNMEFEGLVRSSPGNHYLRT
jgi:DNA processing protein